jgi:N-acetylglucosaminyltransferase
MNSNPPPMADKVRRSPDEDEQATDTFHTFDGLDRLIMMSQQQEQARLAAADTMPRVRPAQRPAQRGPGAHRKTRSQVRPAPRNYQPAREPQRKEAVRDAAHNGGRSVRHLQPDTGRPAGQARNPVAAPDVATLTLTVIIPAYNEQAGLPAAIESILKQTVPPDRIIVVDDGSTDDTVTVAQGYPVDVLSHPTGTGSKARAQNYALPSCDTDLLLTIDGDTVLAPDFIRRIKAVFADPAVAVAAGNVQVLHPRNPIERGRQIEYLFGMHFYRPVQNMAGAPVVCSGCASALRRTDLAELGGFPPGTVAEDMDYSWRMMLAGHKAVYVAGAECYVQDPQTIAQLRTQLHRWMAGYMQNIRAHWRAILRGKKMLALWAAVALVDVLSVPLLLITPVIAGLLGLSPGEAVLQMLGLDLVMTLPVVVIGAVRRKANLAVLLLTYPCVYINRAFNAWYAMRALVVELIMVPLGLTEGLQVFEKGH